MKKVIYQSENSVYWLVNSPSETDAPPGHVSLWCGIKYRNRYGRGFLSPQYIVQKASFYPAPVVQFCEKLLRFRPGDPKNESWVRQMYSKWAHTYRLNSGRIVQFWNDPEGEKEMPLEQHMAVIKIRQYDPSHEPQK